MAFNRLILAVAITALLCGTSAADEPKPVEIPLKDIWAYSMPGTRAVEELEPDKFGEQIKKLPSEDQVRLLHESMTTQIRWVLGQSLPDKPHPQVPDSKPAFAVLGAGRDALQRAFATLVEKKKPQQKFPSTNDVSLVFYSYEMGSFVHLQEVKRLGNIVQIRYRFFPHPTMIMSEHFALIPLGKLPSGDYRVEIIQTPMDTTYIGKTSKPLNEEWGQQVCQPFSFTVEENSSK